ncbi:peptidyl-prolyl cis-trans isomerase [Roseibium album]|uniref:peptidyl-prolyl cis-trans isomerase n=1 Tax=Roseibium album TaxID=311410 RepID=UPI0024936863|nr:peptidyl-prolyl cis-trans isomerase [Roseibium album]
MTGIRRLASQPLVHFLLLGSLIFAAYGFISPPPESEPVDENAEIVVTQQKLQRLVTEFEAVWQRLPTEAEKQTLVASYVREEVLVREALKLGLDRDDIVLRRRLVQKMDFLTTAAARSRKPTEEDLKSYYDANRNAYLRSGRISYEQVFLGSPADEELAEEVQDRLRQGADPEVLGRQTLLPFRLDMSARSKIDGVFGDGFYERIEALPLNEWSGPVQSGYGQHLIRVTQRQSAEYLPFESIRNEVEADWALRKAEELRDDAYAAMRERYRIVLPETGQ